MGPMTMTRLAAAAVLAACLPGLLAAQPIATLTRVKQATEPVYFSNPVLGVKGTMRPIPGSRLEIVAIALGDMSIESDLRQFTLIAADGVVYEPIAAGGGPDLIFPIDSLPVGREMGQILPSDAQVSLKRLSSTTVMLEADPGATLAFVFQLPAAATLRALRLPDGSELSLVR
jgi:hypothetical protein